MPTNSNHKYESIPLPEKSAGINVGRNRDKGRRIQRALKREAAFLAVADEDQTNPYRTAAWELVLGD